MLRINTFINLNEQLSMGETVKNVEKEQEDKEEHPNLEANNITIIFKVENSSKCLKLNVPRVYYEALAKVSDTSEFCFLCNFMYVTDLRNAHRISKCHIDNLNAKPLDNNGVRKINETHFHCAICKDYFIDHNSHVSKVEHLKNFIQAIIQYECGGSGSSRTGDAESSTDINKNTDTIASKSVKPSNSSTSDENLLVLCEVCNENVKKNQLEKHQDTTKHRWNNISDYHYLLSLAGDGNLLCEICDKSITHNPAHVKEHFHCPLHVSNYRRLLKQHGVAKVKTKQIFRCHICNVNFLIKNEMLHILSQKHKDKFSTYNESDEESGRKTESTDSDDTDATYVAMDDTTGKINSNIATGNATVGTANSGEAVDDSTGTYMCNLCYVSVPRNRRSILEHNRGKLHKVNSEQHNKKCCSGS